MKQNKENVFQAPKKDDQKSLKDENSGGDTKKKEDLKQVANQLTVVNPQSKKKIEIFPTDKPSFSSEAKQKPISSNPFFKSDIEIKPSPFL